jgi:DNA-binding response OmpR family regulator
MAQIIDKENKPRILYVEDDLTLSFVTIDNLKLRGFNITHASEGMEALAKFRNGHFDLCILDIMLPKMDGYTLAKLIRKENEQVPIIFLSAKSAGEDKIEGLKLGADDYLTKPFSIEELVLKIHVFLKRSQVNSNKKAEIPPIISLGEYKFNYQNLELEHPDQKIKLTQRESDLIRLFWEHKNTVLKREEILSAIWGDDNYFSGRSLDVFISRLRKYLKADKNIRIVNYHGVGFCFKTE